MFATFMSKVKNGGGKPLDLCRCCFKQSDNMKCLLNTNEEAKALLSKLASVIDLKIELGNKYPSYLCVTCEIQVNSFFEFRQQYKKNDELILQYWVDLNKKQSDITNLKQNIITNITEDHNYYSNILINSYKQFTNDDITATIKLLKEKYSVDELSSNKGFMGNWCSVCNQVFSDDKEHSQIHLADFFCLFCNFQMSSLDATIEHLVSHIDSGYDLEAQNEYPEENGGFTPGKSIAKNCKKQRKRFVEMPKRNSTNQKMRLEQYRAEDVSMAIKSVREKLNKHIVCIFCKFVAHSNRSLSVHVSRIHSEHKSQWCAYCNAIVDQLDLHSKEVHRDDLKCPFCHKIQSTLSHFMEHMASHSTTRTYRCNICYKSFISGRHLKIHQRIHDKNSSENDASQDAIENKLDSSSDIEVSPSLAQNFCQKCHKKVRSLSQHNSKLHSMKPPNVGDTQCLCVYCGKQFKTKYKLTVHVRTHTGETPYKCRYCDRRLKTRNILVEHERTHTGEKPYGCNFCGKRFGQTSALNTHMKIHTGRPEECKICLKRFCRPSELRLHLRKHTGEKPYACDHCEQRFMQKSHLVEHVRRHSEERPFKCHECEKTFKSVSTYKGHLQIHTGDKPFKCSQCSYACRQSYSLTKHMQQHEVDQPQGDCPHTCELCQKNFTSVAHLISHYNRSHPLVEFRTEAEIIDI